MRPAWFTKPSEVDRLAGLSGGHFRYSETQPPPLACPLSGLRTPEADRPLSAPTRSLEGSVLRPFWGGADSGLSAFRKRGWKAVVHRGARWRPLATHIGQNACTDIRPNPDIQCVLLDQLFA